MHRGSPGAGRGDVVVVANQHGVKQAFERALRARGVRTVGDGHGPRSEAPHQALVVVGPDPATVIALVERRPRVDATRLVVVTPYGNQRLVDVGAVVVPSSATLDELLLAIEGRRVSSSALRSRRHVSRPRGGTVAAPLEDLTGREREVLRHLLEPVSHDEIANELDISRNTVRTHVRNIYAKIGAHDRVEAARIALRAGVVPPHRKGVFERAGDVA